MTGNGSQTSGELVYRAFAAVLRSEGLVPATDLPARIDAFDEDARLVLAFLLARREMSPEDAAQSLPDPEGPQDEGYAQLKGEAEDEQDGEFAQSARATQLPGEVASTDLPPQDISGDATDEASGVVPDEAAAEAINAADTTSDQDFPDQKGSFGQDLPDGAEPQSESSGTFLPAATGTEPVTDDAPGTTQSTPESQATDAGRDLEALDESKAQETSKEAAGETVASDADATPAASSTTPDAAARDHPQEPQATQKGSSMIDGPGGIPKVGNDPKPEPERISLPNGRTNTDYAAQIDGYADIRLRDDNGTNLSITPDGVLRGAAMPAGEYKLLLGASKGGRPVEILARLSVIPRPQDLWKAIPSDQQAPLAKTDEASELLLGHGLVAAASKRGRSHAQDGSYRDDHFEIDVSPQTGWHILIVADGAGSAPLSREGSKVAAQSAMAALRERLPEALDPHLGAILKAADDAPDTWRDQVIRDHLYPILPKAALGAAAAVEARSKELEKAASNLSTTLIIAVAKKFDDRWFVASFTLGDGGVALYDSARNSVEVMCRPDSGEFAGQTRFLTRREFSDPDQLSQRIFVHLPTTFTALFALTDGITDPKFPTDAVFSSPQAWTAFWDEDLAKSVAFRADNPDLEHQLLEWLDFWSRGNHDDRTIAIFVPQGADPGDATGANKDAAAKGEDQITLTHDTSGEVVDPGIADPAASTPRGPEDASTPAARPGGRE